MRLVIPMRGIALWLPWMAIAACKPSGPTQAELFDLRTKCIALGKAAGVEFAHYDSTRNRCFTAHVENNLGMSKVFVYSMVDGQSGDVLMVCVFNSEEPKAKCEQPEHIGKSRNVSRKEAEDFFRSRMGEDAPLFPDAKPSRN